MDALDRCVVEMEQNGFKLDTQYLGEQLKKAEKDKEEVLEGLRAWLGQLGISQDINWASPKQVIALLHDQLKLPPSPLWKKGRVKLHAGERKLDEAALDWIRGQTSPSVGHGLDLLVSLRRVTGSIKYLSKLPGYIGADGLVHPVYGPASDFDPRAGTITWRLAAKNPEIQQIPADPKKDPYQIRRGFVAPPGYSLLAADEKALESVILAHLLIVLFDDHQLSELLQPGAEDFHSVNARRVFGEYLGWEVRGKPVASYPTGDFQSEEFPELEALRRDIKAVWYGLMYFKSAYGFATSLRDAQGKPIGETAADKIVGALYQAVPGIPKFQNFIRDYAREFHGAPGLGGEWCDLSALYSSGNKWELARADRIAGNYAMQTGGARVIGHAMQEISKDRWLQEEGVKVERQIHDELDFRFKSSINVPKMKSKIEQHMTSYPLRSQLQVSMGTGQNWAEC